MGRVGIFDSGIGGLSVLAEFLELAPGHPTVYLADQAWAPYGERSLNEVRDRAEAITRHLEILGCGVIVVACNSASAAALHYLRDVFPNLQFVGMEPAVKPAANHSARGVIGVLATDATFQGELYASVVDRHANGTTIVERACPGLAMAIEQFGGGHHETDALVEQYVGPLREAGVDTIVLGCTHYPLVLDAIQHAAGAGITVIDPAPAVARQTLRLVGHPSTGGDVEYLTTGDANQFAAQIERTLGVRVKPQPVSVGMGVTVSTHVVVGDLTVQDVDALVNAANRHLQHGGGVAGAIARAGGPAIQSESDAWVEANGPLAEGQAAVTSAGELVAHNVIHVAGPIYRKGQDNEGLLRAAVTGALDAANELGARSIAFPAISAGIYGYPVAEATAVIASEIHSWLRQGSGTIREIRLVAFDPTVARHFETAMGSSAD